MRKRKNMKKRNGYIIHSDSWRIVIATMSSQNRKTGNMVQTWILNRRENPVKSIASGTDARVCGDCPLRGNRGKERGCYNRGKERGCYVNVGHAPLGIWKSWKSGGYQKAESGDYGALFGGREIRFGAYGDPVHIPLPKLAAIAASCAGFTGYTHQWRNPVFRAYRQFLMASVENEKDAKKAWRAGWRTFRIADQGLAGEIECPSARGIECRDCKLCAGNSRPAKSIFIPAHGTGANFIQN
jgi:hypothetical protein